MIKRLALTFTALVCLSAAALAQTSITLAGTDGTITPGSAFTSTITLTIGPNSIGQLQSINALLATPDSGVTSGAAYFTITGITPIFPFTVTTGVGTAAFNTPGDAANSGSTVTNNDVGVATSPTGTPVAPAGSVFTPETITFTSLASTPVGTYNFYFTSGGSTDPGNQGSFLLNTSNVPFSVNSTPAFSITVVPEPATWSLMALGGLGAVGLTVLRRRRAA